MTFDQLLTELESARSVTAKNRLAREFANAQSSPIIEEARATFFYVSEDARQVVLEGDWTNWQPTAPMAYLPDTPLWYRIERFPRAARLEYRIVVNGTRRLLDPRNPRVAPKGLGPHSEVVMPDYRAPREITDAAPGARGTVEQHWMTSRYLGDRRTFWVCLPPRFDSQKKYPVAYFNDGDGYLHFADLPRLADYLIAHGQVEPFIAVLLKPNDREKEYARNNQYVRFLSNELVPWIDSMYPTRNEPSARAIIGASYGALIAAHVARRRPNVFGLVSGQSGFYGYQKDALARDYAAATNLNIRFHLVVGEFETDLRGDGRMETASPLGMDFVAAQRRFVELVRSKGYDVFSAEYPEGHQWGFWRAHVGDALRFFWGSQ
jgi:enterochelin esterase family protein